MHGAVFLLSASSCAAAARADCPLHLTKFQLTEFGTVKDVQHYSVTALTQDSRPYSMQVLLTAAGSASAVLVDVPRATPAKAADSYVSRIDFRWRGPSIQSVAPRRLNFDGAALQCDAASTKRDDPQGEVGLSLEPDVPLRGASSVGAGPLPAIVDAHFLRKVQPAYPATAKSRDEEGTVVLLVTIGPDAVVKDTKVSESSGFPDLDDAARASSFGAPSVGGKPSTETYRIVYTFSLDPVSRTTPAPSCRLTVIGVSFLGRTSAGWGFYGVALGSDIDTFGSADFALDIAGAPSPLSLRLPSLHLDKGDHGYTGHAKFLWAGNPIEQLALADTMLAESDKPVACKFNLYNVIPDRSAADAPSSAGAPQASPGSSKIVSPAVFTNLVLPEYPRSQAKARASCDIRVIVVVDSRGETDGRRSYRDGQCRICPRGGSRRACQHLQA
ncbi:MAG: energy transducer TonB [Candidatus Eremiobacteraeota bacterium]|nr:energy transducer TonB [Candidatus Eremiobacteraeota bacterium]MBC5827888.1 energy transducer TonB [Candidatus Eremiobacteraeota bacterium]